MTREPDWSERQARTIGAEVRRHRTRLGWSAQQLADRCLQLGLPIARSTIANMENNRRPAVSAAELLVLGAALEVPPAELMFPIGRYETVEALPGRSVPPWDAARWFSGEATPERLPAPKLRMDDAWRTHDVQTRYVRAARDREAREAAEGAKLARQRRTEMHATRQEAEQAQDLGRAVADSQLVTAAWRDAIQVRLEAERGLREIRAAMRAADLIPPPLPRDLASMEPVAPADEYIPEPDDIEGGDQ